MNRNRNRLLETVVMALLGCLLPVQSLLAQPAIGDDPPAGESAAAEATDGGTTEKDNDGDGGPGVEATRSLPKLAELKLPTAEELLRGQKLDWVVLKDEDEHVLISEPVTPRPDTLAKMQVALDEKLKDRKNVRGDDLEQYRIELEEMAHIDIAMPAQFDETEYQLHMNKVSRIIYHEDLMLQRVDALIADENFELGYELLNALRRNTPDWPGAAERHGKFLLAEASRRLKRGDLESALATVEEVYERSSTFKGVPELAGTVVDRLVQESVEADDWPRARYFINRLDGLYKDHPAVLKWRNDLASRAEQLLSRSEAARTQGDNALAAIEAETAAIIWPQTRNLRTRHRIYANRYQRLHVGVLELPSTAPADPVLTTRADRRAAQMQQLTFFHVDHASDGSAHYSSRFCDRWEPFNLGRDAMFELRRNRQPWEMQPILTAPRIAETIAARLDPNSPQFDERLAGYASSVNVTSPYSFRIRFNRVPVRTEALLKILLEPPAAETPVATAERESPVSVESGSAIDGGFELAEMAEEKAVYRRVIPEPDGLRLYHVAEVVEHRYKDFGEVQQALLRGEISMAPSLPPRFVERLRSEEELLKALFIEKMALPQTHVVQLHPRSVALRNRELRRALTYGIDRPKILTQTILDGASEDLARIVTGPFPTESYANSALASKREYDPVSAISLTLAARKQLGGTLPPLKMVVIGEPLVQAAASEMVKSWHQFGIEVSIVPPPEQLIDPSSETADWDLLYRTVQMTEPVVQLWPFLALTDRAKVSDLDAFPDWLRQEVINLDLIGDWSAAVKATKELHLHIWSEVMVIPLWEVDQYLVYRKNIRGVPVNPVEPYDEIDGWVVEAWYPEGDR